MKQAVGFIGVGTMGRPMAINLLRAGHQVTVYDVVPEACEAVAEHGAEVAGSPREAAAAGEVVILMLPAAAHVLEATAGADGAIAGLRPNALLIDMSTIDPATSQQVAAAVKTAGGRMLDAPVSGGDTGATAGTLTIMVGGERADFDQAHDLFSVMGSAIIYCGAHGMGEAVKLCNNLILGVSMIAIAEGFALGMRAGVDPHLLFEVLSKSTSRSWAMEARLPVPGVVPGSPANDDFAPGFMTDLMQKDLGLALVSGNQLQVPLAMTALAHQVYTMTSGLGYGRNDFSAVMKTVMTFLPDEQSRG